MKTSLKTLLAASLLCSGLLGAAGSASAQPGGFSFRAGDVVIGYQNGYYDRGHRWHNWGHARERDWYRNNYRHSYRASRYDRDRDGVPNWADSRPRNPNRR